jgi:predicted RNA binding protein YcfA (HicA-like mRNA interferase family)
VSGHHPPLTCDEFKAVLRKHGFAPRPRKGQTAGSHEHWVKRDDWRIWKVTVDCPKAPFSHDLISSMARQAGLTRKQVYETHFGR